MKTLRCCTADLSDEKTEITTFWKLNPTSVRVIDLTPLPHFPIDRFERRRGEGEDRRNEGGRRGVCKMFMMVLILLYIPQLAESNSTGKVTIPSITGINVLCHLINTHDTSPIVLIIFLAFPAPPFNTDPVFFAVRLRPKLSPQLQYRRTQSKILRKAMEMLGWR